MVCLCKHEIICHVSKKIKINKNSRENERMIQKKNLYVSINFSIRRLKESFVRLY